MKPYIPLTDTSASQNTPSASVAKFDEQNIVLIECMQQLKQLCTDVETYYNNHKELGPVIARDYRQIREHSNHVAYHLSEIVRASLLSTVYYDD